MLTEEFNLSKNKIFFAAKHIFKRLIHSPLLVGWLIIGTIMGSILYGYKGFIATIYNLISLTLYVLIIKVMTDNSPRNKIIPLKHPKFELILGIFLYILSFIVVFFIWKQIVNPIKNYIFFHYLIVNMKTNIINFGIAVKIPVWCTCRLWNALLAIIIDLIPLLILYMILGYNFREMGFRFTNLTLTIILIAITILIGIPSKILFGQPIYKIIILYFIQIFINGLPEELFFRGYLLPRFESFFKNPINALVIVSILFNLIHIPSELAHGLNIYSAILDSFTLISPTGLIWGYLYLKTRSIVPGIFWHTSGTVLGDIFINI